MSLNLNKHDLHFFINNFGCFYYFNWILSFSCWVAKVFFTLYFINTFFEFMIDSKIAGNLSSFTSN